jgi:hypothetical protein
MHRSRKSRVQSRKSKVIVFCVVAVFCGTSVSAQERFRISINAGQQTSTTTVSQQQTLEQYFEQGSFTFERPVPTAVIYDFGIGVRLWRGLHAGAAVSVFNDKTGPGTVTARVPHPLQFNKPRTVTGEVPNATRRELGQHIMFGWNVRAAGGLDFLLFAGPSIFATDQLLVKSLRLSLDNEVFPFDELAFPPVESETLREDVLGYNAGVDMTWRFARNLGVGLLVRYSEGKKAFTPTPTGSAPANVTVGGLHAGGGLRLIF